CPDVLTGGAKGRWLTRPLTPEEQKIIDTYLRNERGAYHIPPTYQRDDGRCGDVPYEQSPLYRHMWFKAICNPNGTTPCCHTNTCLPLSVDECRCPTCYDERQAVHTEFATWRPDDARCLVKTFGSQEACGLLNGSTLYFVGDSFIRHVFAAMVILLSNNTVDGALRSDVELSKKARCTGMHQITGLTCRDLLDENRSLCQDTVHVRYVQVFPSQELPLTEPLLNALRHVNKSLVIMGLGIHDDFNFNVVRNKFLLPFLNMRQYLSTSRDTILDVNKVLTNFGRQDSDTRAGNHTQTTLFKRVGDVSGPSLAKNNNPELFLSLLLTLDGRNSTFFKNGSQIVENFPLEVKPEGGPPIIKEDGPSIYSIFTGKAFNFKDSTFTGIKQREIAETVKYINNIGFGGLGTGPHVRHMTSFHTGPHERDTSPLLSPQTEGVDVERLWPRLLWIGAHAPGLLKSPKFKRQTAEGVQEFNTQVQRVLRQWRVPYLDTFSLTNGTVSFDGTHYGWGTNMMKLNMILTYMEAELIKGWD
ncbi:unnamed protein product, partial [Lymnaea stagnalis]